MPEPMVPDLVSTIIPVHNRPAMLREAVESVLAQTYWPIEIIIVDDASTDETPAVCDQLATEHTNEIRAFHQESNTGPGPAREKGRIHARGEFIQYLDSDDLLGPEKFEIQVDALREKPNCGVAYGITAYQRSTGTERSSPWKRTGERIEAMFPSFLQSRWWDTSTPLFRRALTDAAGPWLDLSLEEDWEYDCRVASLGVNLVFCPELVSITREHSDSRLNRMGLSRSGLKGRAAAHEAILRHATRASIPRTSPEMQHFSRELFLLARQCGAASLTDESRILFKLASETSMGSMWQLSQFWVYRTIATALGWRNAGRLSYGYDSLRSKLRENAQLHE